jgi:hypothetical protein
MYVNFSVPAGDRHVWGKAMRGTVGNLVLATMVAFIMSGATISARAEPDSAQIAESLFLTTNEVLRASLDRILRGSALWREAVEAIGKTGRHVVLVTPSDPIVAGIVAADFEAFDSGVLAETVPLIDEDWQVDVVLVFVNLPLLTAIHDARLSVPLQFEADLDRILVHEVYGHSIPYLLAGDLSGRCADPKPGERASESCSIRRENTVRAELGLGRRGDAGLSSLTLAWGRRLDRD